MHGYHVAELTKSVAEVIDQLYWTALSRPPSEPERKAAIEAIRVAGQRPMTFQDIGRAFLNELSRPTGEGHRAASTESILSAANRVTALEDVAWALLLKVGWPFLSYVDVTPGSLEARIWPSYRVRCRWEDVERMGKNPNWGASYHVLRLKQAEPLEENTLTVILGRLPGWVSARSQYSVPLNSFRGYPTGDFADDLRCYAPHLFVPEAESIGNRLA